jgi:hypothetical protein
LKTCTSCKTDKPLDEFRNIKKNGEVVRKGSMCLACRREYNQQWYKNNPDYKREWRNRNKEATVLSNFKNQLNQKYGLRYETYLEMLESQGGVCYLCEKPSNRNLCVDHCHVTGEIRKLLCFICNRALGLFQDDVQILSSALNYLESYG